MGFHIAERKFLFSFNIDYSIELFIYLFLVTFNFIKFLYFIYYYLVYLSIDCILVMFGLFLLNGI